MITIDISICDIHKQNKLFYYLHFWDKHRLRRITYIFRHLTLKTAWRRLWSPARLHWSREFKSWCRLYVWFIFFYFFYFFIFTDNIEKMSTKTSEIECAGCRNNITKSRDFLKCSTYRQTYDLLCANILKRSLVLWQRSTKNLGPATVVVVNCRKPITQIRQFGLQIRHSCLVLLTKIKIITLRSVKKQQHQPNQHLQLLI